MVSTVSPGRRPGDHREISGGNRNFKRPMLLLFGPGRRMQGPATVSHASTLGGAAPAWWQC
jgi:hypothetical protein